MDMNVSEEITERIGMDNLVNSSGSVELAKPDWRPCGTEQCQMFKIY